MTSTHWLSSEQAAGCVMAPPSRGPCGGFSSAGGLPAWTELFVAPLGRAACLAMGSLPRFPFPRCRRPRVAAIYQEVTVMLPEGKEPCAFCGSLDWVEAHFTAGRLVCATCWAGRKPAVAMPPSARGKAAIAAWIAPRPPKQQSLNLRELVNPGGVSRG